MRYAPQTKAKIEKYESLGYEIVENKQPLWNRRKMNENYEVVRLAITNSRYRGYCKRAIWARRPKTALSPSTP